MRYRKENVLAVILGVILTIAVSFYTSFVVLNLFNWFVGPVFSYTFKYWQCYGLMLICDLFTTKIKTKDDNGASDFATVIGVVLAKIVIVSLFFGVGALVHLGF